MKTITSITSILALSLACAALPAQTLGAPSASRDGSIVRPSGDRSVEAWLDAALAKDAGLRAKRIELEKARSALGALEAPSLIAPSLSTGTSTLSLPSGGAPASLSATPSIQASLSEPWGTNASLSVGVETPLDASAAPEYEPTFALSQPLNALFFPGESVELLKARATLADAVSAVAVAEATSRAETLALLQTWASATHEAASARVTQAAADREFANAKTLGDYAPTSAAYAILSNAATSAGIAVRRADTAELRARSALYASTGLDDEAPPLPPPGDLAPLTGLTPESARAVAQARRRLALEERSWNDAWGAPKPALAAQLSAAQASPAGSSESVLTGRIGASAAWETLELSAGMGWDGADDAAFIDFSLAWKPGRASDRSADRTIAALSLEAARLELASALDEAGLDLEDLAAARADRAFEARLLDQARELAWLETKELEAQVAAGIAANADLNEAIDEWRSAAADVEKAAWNRAIADARVAADYTLKEVME